MLPVVIVFRTIPPVGLMVYPLVISQFAMENGPFIVDLPMINCDFP